ncbi:MAG: cell division protein SepF [Acidimicrobiales bacterium]
MSGGTTTSRASFADPELVAAVTARVADLERRVAACGRDPATVRVVAVTKTFPASVVRAAYGAGLDVVGENYVTELVAKRDATRDLPLTWHYLGALQSNKIARAARAADVLCALSRARELDRVALARPGARVYVEVDFTASAARPGAAPDEVPALVAHGRALGLDVAGLMTVAPIDEAGARAAFAGVRDLADELDVVERSHGDERRLRTGAGPRLDRDPRRAHALRSPGRDDGAGVNCRGRDLEEIVMKERMRKALGFLGLIEDEYGEYGTGTPSRPFTEPGYDDDPEWSTPAAPAPTGPRPFPVSSAGSGPARPVPAARPAPVGGFDGAPRLRPVPSNRIRTLAAPSEDDLAVVAPVSYNESQRVTDLLRAHRPVLLNVTSLDPEVARRVVDFTAGTIYALRAKIEPLAAGVYLIFFADTPISHDTRLRLRAANYRSFGPA